MNGWAQTIRTGNLAEDHRLVEEHRQHAHAQGLVLHVAPLPQGGFHVQAHAPAAMAPAPLAPAAPAYANPYAAPQAPPHGAQAPMVGGGAMGGCQTCGRAAALKKVTFMQNIGLVVLRLPKTIRGHLCRHCIDQYFWQYTTISFFFGWWGVISFITTLVGIPVNIVNYLGALGLPPPPDDAEILAARRSRSTWMIVVGALGVLVSLPWLGVCAGMVISPHRPDDVGAGLVVFFISLIFTLPVWALLIFGIRSRMRASAPAFA